MLFDITIRRLSIITKRDLFIYMKKIGENIRDARIKKGLSQSQLGEKCGWGQGRISNYERGDREPKSGDVKIIAAALGLTAEQLMIGETSINSGNTPKGFAPLITWWQVPSYTKSPASIEPIESYPCPPSHSNKTFALAVEGESMWPEFIDGEIIFIDPEVEPRHGSCVIITINEQASFKQLIYDGTKKYLKSLNPNWPNPITEMESDAKVQGVIIGSYRKR